MDDNKKPFKVTCNEFVFYFDGNDVANLDLIQRSADTYHCISGNRSVNAVITKADKQDKQFNIAIDGDDFSIQIKDKLDQMLEVMGFGQAANKLLTNVKAPMPGLVLDIAVEEGQTIQRGDKILILEAMKMENSIIISADAIIKKILVKKGQAVEKGQVLVELE